MRHLCARVFRDSGVTASETGTEATKVRTRLRNSRERWVCGLIVRVRADVRRLARLRSTTSGRTRVGRSRGRSFPAPADTASRRGKKEAEERTAADDSREDWDLCFPNTLGRPTKLRDDWAD